MSGVPPDFAPFRAAVLCPNRTLRPVLSADTEVCGDVSAERTKGAKSAGPLKDSREHQQRQQVLPMQQADMADTR